ncbi:MAG: glycosyltransferase family protein [Thermoplasmatota archaeon]
MRARASFVMTAVLAAAVFVLGAWIALAAPPSYLHPDEQSAAWPALSLAGHPPRLAPDLASMEPLFRPYKTNWVFGAPLLQTGFLYLGGVGFAYPAFLAPFAAVSFAAMTLSGAFSLALFYIGVVLVLDPRRLTSAFLALGILALPPAVFQAGVLFSNLPGLAFFTLGVGLVCEAHRSGRHVWVPLGFVSALVAAALRIDYAIGAAGLGVFLLAHAGVDLPSVARAGGTRVVARRVFALAAGPLVVLALGVFVFYRLNGTLGVPYGHVAGEAPATNLHSLSDVWKTVSLLFNEDQTASTPAYFELATDNYLFGFVPALLALGPLYLFARRAPESWVVLPLAAQGVAVWAFTAGVLGYGTGCSCIDGSQPRYFLPIYAAALLAALLAVRGFLERLPSPRFATVAAIGIAMLLVVPGIGEAWEGEHGVAWALDQKRWQHGYDVAAAELPSNALVAGNFLSKIVYARPVLVPDYTGDFPGTVDRILWLGRPVYVDPYWLRPGVDERGDYGQQLMRSGHHYLVHAGVKDFYEVHRTNATVREIFDLAPGAWAPAENGTALRATEDPAFFRVVDRADGAIPLNGTTAADATITVTYRDENVSQVVHAGYHNFDSNSTVELAAWAGNGTSAWVTHSFVLPRGLVVTGAMYVTGMPTVRALEVTWS